MGCVCLVRRERDKGAMTEVYALAPMGSPSSACRGRGWQEAATDGSARPGGSPSQCPWRQGLACGRESAMVALLLVLHSTMVPHFQGKPPLFQEHYQLWSSSFPPPQAVSAQLSPSLPSLQSSPCSQHQSFPRVRSPNPTLQHPAHTSIGEHPSQAGAPRAVAQTVRANLALSCLPQPAASFSSTSP